MTSKDFKLTYAVEKSVKDINPEKTLINQVSNPDKDVKYLEKNGGSADKNEFQMVGIEQIERTSAGGIATTAGFHDGQSMIPNGCA
jgi:hypothetical protein